MLTTLAALQLLVLAQVTPPALVGPDDARAADAAGVSSTAQAGPDAAPPPAAPATPPPAAGAPPAATVATPPPATPERPVFVSLQSAEPLRGSTAVFTWGGWPRIGAAYLVGVTAQDDLGAVADLDWSRTEFRLGGIYRRPIGAAGGWESAFRVGLAWYAGFGSSWVYADNHADRGIELAPAIILSRRAGGGVLSISVEAPMTVTTRYDSGFLFVPKLAGAYEAPLMDGVTLGARVGVGYRAGAGDAPLKEGKGELEFLILAGWQLL